MEFEVAALLIELKHSNQRITELLERDHKLLREVLERLPKPTYPQPVAAGSRLVVTE